MAAITKQELEDAAVDAQTLEDVANGDSSTTVTSRLGTAVKSVAKAISEISSYNDTGAWATSTAYAIKDLVQESGVTYICITPHTSGTFATDLAAGKWGIFQTQTPEVYLSSYVDINAAITAISSQKVVLVIDKDVVLTGNLVVPGNIQVKAVGYEFSGAYNLTISGGLIAPLQTVFDSTVNVITIDAIPYVYPQWWGAVGDGSNDDTTAIQSAATVAVASNATLLLVPTSNGSVNFKITSPISLTSGTNIVGINANNVNLLCVGCDGLSFSAGAQRCTLRGFGIAQSVRHTTTPNGYSGIVFAGSTGSRPYWNVLENLFIDGFQRAIYGNWLWETTITKCKTLFGGVAIDLDGVCANNYIHHNSFSGTGTLLDFGDSTNTIEGIHVNNNLLDGISLGEALDWKGVSYSKFNDNVCDFMGGGTAILIRSAGTLPTIGNSIRGNYIAISAAGDEGIRLLNSLAPTEEHGNIVSENVIFAYATHSLSRGILIDGTQEINNKVINNNINATVADVDNAGTDTLVTGNTFNGAGFNTTKECIYANNKGTIISSVVFHTIKQGNITEYWASSIPTSGSYVIGDVVHYTGPAIDGNNMVLLGWKRLTTGSGHVLNTDWAAMYISTVSPAT